MKTSTKISHKENVSNLNVLIARIGTFGESYNPSNLLLKVSSLNTISTNGQNANAAVDATDVIKKNAQSARSLSFDGLDPLVDRSINALKISGASAQTIEQAKAIARDIHGRRASEIVKPDAMEAAKIDGIAVRQVVKHIADFNTRANNMSIYALFINSVAEYKPNETDISKTGLTAKSVELNTKNADILTAETEHDNAILNRNSILYFNDDNLVDIGLNTKLYVKSAYGFSSVQYKQISGLIFRKLA